MDKSLEYITQLDGIIADYAIKQNLICQRYVSKEGTVRVEDKKSFDDAMSENKSDFETKWNSTLNSIDELCKQIRSNQPLLIELGAGAVNQSGFMPDEIALGRYHVLYEIADKNEVRKKLELYMPRLFSFPLKKAMYISEKSHFDLFKKILLRLMFALPMDRQEYYVFDPVSLGETVMDFNLLLKNANLFPQQRVMTNQMELKAALKEVKEYINSLYETAYKPARGIVDWQSYNKYMQEHGDIKKLLPYKVFILTDLPTGIDQECFDMIKIIMTQGYKCGCLILFSFNENILKAEDTMNRQMQLELKTIIDDSLPLHEVLDRTLETGEFRYLKVESSGEQFPTPSDLGRNLIEFDQIINEKARSMFSFDELLADENLMTGRGDSGLDIPIGFSTSGGDFVSMVVGDRTPHYLVGGITGSGKSNFLHTLITSACWKYSVEEMELYLLDFKEGVEFRQYATYKLANARLVATEADTEYGVKVLEHLDRIRAERYACFKKAECKDIRAYNSIAEKRMPRILVVVDEFQVLFDNNQKDRTLEMFTMLAKQGRACGIHMVLATQSLKGLDFGNVASQFGGRIALKCSADDSKLLLGGITSNNEEASVLSIPYAIMNVSQGSVSGNIKFAVPCAVPDSQNLNVNPVESKIKIINDNNTLDISDIHIFEGQKFPKYPHEDAFKHLDDMVLTLGETLDYNADLFEITLKARDENNVLICGRDEKMKRDFIKSCVMSVLGCKALEACIYIGDDINRYGLGYLMNDIEKYNSIVEFIESYKDNWFGFSKVVILDNCNLGKEIDFPPSSYSKDENRVQFMELWSNGCKNSSFIVAFYDGMNSIRNNALPMDNFMYRIGYSINK